MDPGPSSGPVDDGLSKASGPKVPPRRNGSRAKKGTSSGSSQAAVVASQPMAGDDCAINDLLEGRTDLCLVLPDHRHIIVNVERRTPVMDLLVQVATANKINPSNHVIQVSNDRGYVCKPNTPVGSLDVKELYIIPKVSHTSSDLTHKRLPKRAPQPFEPTFRLQVRLPKNQLMVLRVNLGTTLAQVKQTACEEKGLDPQGYQLVAIGRLPVAALDLALTLEQYGSTEVGLMSNRALAASIQNTATDLISYSMNKECKKGIISLLTHHRSKGSLTGSSSDGVSSRGTSPVRMDPLCQTIAPNPPTAPSRTSTKKRPAPPPPVANQVPEEPQVKAVAGSSKGEQQESIRTHSRQSSDSSGYHEASVLSDLPETPSPEAVCNSSGACSLDSPPQSLEVARPRRGPRKARPSSMASDASSGKKRRAPPPPPPPSTSTSSSAESDGAVVPGTSPTVFLDLDSAAALRCANEEGPEECSENDSVLSTPKGDFECGRLVFRGSTNPTPRPRLTLRHKKGQSSVQAETYGEPEDAADDRKVPSDTNIIPDEASTVSQLSWEYNIPEPPSPFRTCAPNNFDPDSASDVKAENELKEGSDTSPVPAEQSGVFNTDTGTQEDCIGNIENEKNVCAVTEVSSTVPSSNEPPCTVLENSNGTLNSFGAPFICELSESGQHAEVSQEPESSKDGEDIHKLRPIEDLSGKFCVEEEISEEVPARAEDKSSRAPETKDVVTSSPVLGRDDFAERLPDSVVKSGKDAQEAGKEHGEPFCVTTTTPQVLEHSRGESEQAENAQSVGHVEKQLEPLSRSHSVNYGPISFSIGSYGSYKTEAVDDIFSVEPGKAPMDRFKNIKVASSPRVSTVEEKVTVTINNCPEAPEKCKATARLSPEKTKAEDCPTLASSQVLTVAIGKEAMDDRLLGKECTNQPTLARASSLLDLRDSASNNGKPREQGGLADEKDVLLTEYAKLQLQFVAWQQQLACNQNLLENKKIVPCMSSTALNGSPERSKSTCEAGATLPRSKPSRPLSLVVQPSRLPLSGASPPKVQFGSWKEHRDDSAFTTLGSEDGLSSTLVKSHQKRGAPVGDVGSKAKQADSPVKPKTLPPLSKADPKPVFKRPMGVLSSAPTVRGFSQESVSKIVEEMAHTRKDSLNGRTVIPSPSVPDAHVQMRKSVQNILTSDVSGQNNAVVHSKPLQECAKSTRSLSSVKENDVKRTLHDEITKCSRLPSATTSDANKPSVVRATLKSGMPPIKQQMNNHIEDDKRTTNGQVKEAANKGKMLSPPAADPREVLMNEIRSFGGKTSLKKVSTEPAWQLNICNVRPAPV
ncbi:uncharacterized protein LOC135400193 isoform X2 [Ornithodoros turicata]|uniref:uncharacterized protein LOC135400193 isoform X2 n=1 Tax=Ornithodoros turicata TaxID=34597 RepID=UPI003139661D